MIFIRTFCSFKMTDQPLWVFIVTIQALILSASCGSHNLRRSMGTQGGLPVSKGGWRPVVGGTSGHLYGSYGTSQFHAPTYKLPMLDLYQSSSRPYATKDASKLTSIAQSYRPTTLRTVSTASAVPPINQPINTYHNPFALQNSAFANYKFVQNYPSQSLLVRNPHPYLERPFYAKYPTKLKQTSHFQNGMLQQLTNIQPIQFAQYQTSKPLDLFGKPIENYARPNEAKKPQAGGIETFKPEVFKLDNDAAPQAANQQVKTVQQHSIVGSQHFLNAYPQYTLQDSALPPSILGSFGSFGIQTVKSRDPVFQFPTTFGPSQSTKQTLFNSFSYTPTYKTTPTVFEATSPKGPTTANQISFGTTYTDLKVTPTPQTKVYVPPKIDPNAGLKDGFKPSPQDPFTNKHHPSDYNKVFVSTYNPGVQTTTLANNYYDYSFSAQQNRQQVNYQDQQDTNYNYDKSLDNLAAGNQQPAPTKAHNENIQNPYRPTYEVTESTESELSTQSSPAPWSLTSDLVSEKKHEIIDTVGRLGAPSHSTHTPDIPEEFAIVTEAENGHDNSLRYDGQVESQSRRPSGEDFEPIGKHKLKDYYYKVSTPNYDDYSTSRRTKKPTTEAARYTSTQESTSQFNNNKENVSEQTEVLPTLAPNQYFKRPVTSDINDRDKTRKRNKIRRRRPAVGNINRNKEETSTIARFTSTTYSTTEPTLTTDADEVYTIKPRVRPTKSPLNLTTPTVTTDLTTGALPTISPTNPTIVKKKLAHRRPVTTTTTKPETTTHTYVSEELHQDSQIMKISNRPHLPNLNDADPGLDFRTYFSHKQDEKDTPTSDVAVSLSDSLRTTVSTKQEFNFHKDFKPIELKLEPVTNSYKETTTDFYREDHTDYNTTPRSESSTTERAQRPRLRNKFNRTKFNVKDYRNRLGSTTTTEKSIDITNTPKLRFPNRRIPYSDTENETTTERKRFTPKEPRHKIGNGAENNEQTEKDTHSFKPSRQRQTTTDYTEATTPKVSSRVRTAQRRPRPPEDTTETSSPTTVHSKRPLRKKIKDSDVGESVQDYSVTDTTVYEKNDITSERTRSESAIMKIADKKHQDHLEHLFEHSKRVSDLTLAASKDYNKPGMFKTVASNSRRIPNYFTIATDDPILPIEAFFPQLNQKKES